MELGELILLVFCKQAPSSWLPAGLSIHPFIRKQLNNVQFHPVILTVAVPDCFILSLLLWLFFPVQKMFLFYFTLLFIAKQSEPLLCL